MAVGFKLQSFEVLISGQIFFGQLNHIMVKYFTYAGENSDKSIKYYFCLPFRYYITGLQHTHITYTKMKYVILCRNLYAYSIVRERGFQLSLLVNPIIDFLSKCGKPRISLYSLEALFMVMPLVFIQFEFEYRTLEILFLVE